MNEQQAEEFDDDAFSEGTATLQIFPVEIWEQIFGHVADSKDLQNFGKAFPFWEDFLHQTKQAWLFEKVFLHIWGYLTKKEILGCRVVCKRWSSSVDHFLENNEYHCPTDNETGNYLRLRPLIRGLHETGLHYSFYSTVRMEKMCHVASNVTSNPIIGRSVSIDWESVPLVHLPFLKQFGRYIWHLRVLSTHREIQPIPFILRILDYLPYLPNLRKLELYLWEGHGHAENSGNASPQDLNVKLSQPTWKP